MFVYGVFDVIAGALIGAFVLAFTVAFVLDMLSGLWGWVKEQFK